MIPAAAVERLLREREAQGLPPRLSDPAAVERVVAAIRQSRW